MLPRLAVRMTATPMPNVDTVTPRPSAIVGAAMPSSPVS